MSKILNEKQIESLKALSDAFSNVNNEGLALMGSDGIGSAAISKRETIKNYIDGNITDDTNIEYTDKQKEVAQALRQKIDECSDCNLLFHCDPNGIYAIDADVYKSFPEDCSAEEWDEFKNSVTLVDDRGAYYQTTGVCTFNTTDNAPNACVCSSCDCGCDLGDSCDRE